MLTSAKGEDDRSGAADGDDAPGVGEYVVGDVQ